MFSISSLSFADFNIIIEAKRYDEKQQNQTQHKDQLITYFDKYQEEDEKVKKVYYVLLGGLHKSNTIQKIEVANTTVQLSKLKWSTLLDAIVAVKKSIEKQSLNYQNPVLFLLEDIITVLAIHGFHKKIWLSSLPITTINQTSITNFKYKIHAN